MRRRLAALLTSLLFGLLALPSGAAPLAVLLVYPFAVDETTPVSLGSGLADQIAAEVAAQGGISVIHGDAKRSDYRSVARADGADAYFTGSIVSIGSSTYMAIEQLASSRSGVLIWSRAIHFRTLADAVGAGQLIHDELVHPPRVQITEAQPAPRTTPSTAPSVARAITTAAPVAPPTPLVLATTAKSAFAVMPVSGAASPAERTYAAAALVAGLKLLGLHAVAIAQSIDPKTGGASLCATTGAIALLGSTLATKREPGKGPPQFTATVALRGYRCQAKTLDPDLGATTSTAEHDADAIRQAINNNLLLLPSVYLTRNGA